MVEREGVARSERARAIASLTLVVVDQSEALTAEDEQLLERDGGKATARGGNKSDLFQAGSRGRDVGAHAGKEPLQPARRERFRPKTGDGLDGVARRYRVRADRRRIAADTATRLEHATHRPARAGTRVAVAAASAAAAGDTPEEFVLADLQAARTRLDEIVGVRTSDDVLRHIFERFCIGK